MSEKQKKKKEEATLETMLECSKEFNVRGAKYFVRPLFLEEVVEFNRDELSIGPQYINLADEGRAKVLDKWLKRTVFDKDGKPMSLKSLEGKHWTLKDLREVLQELIDLSG